MRSLLTIEKPAITHIQLVKYAGASGDFNPVHTVKHLANEKGYRDVIVHGMFLMGWVSQAINSWFPSGNLTSLNVRFQEITYTGDKLFIYGTWDDSENGDSKQPRGKVNITDQFGKTKLTGKFDLSKSKISD